jgi:hypothetical protein
VRAGPGRPREYCRQGCRQQAFLARKLAAAHGLADDEVIVARGELEVLQDRLALLRYAIGDIEREEATGGGPVDPRAAYDWLIDHAREVVALRIEPAWGERSRLT